MVLSKHRRARLLHSNSCWTLRFPSCIISTIWARYGLSGSSFLLASWSLSNGPASLPKSCGIRSSTTASVLVVVFTVASLGEEVEMHDTMGVAVPTETQASDDACETTDTTGRAVRGVVTAGSWVAVECYMNSSGKVEVLACHGLKH